MNLVYIEGPVATVAGLEDIADVILKLASAQETTPGNVRVWAYATDRAITEIQSREATVTVLQNNEELQATLDDLFNRIEESDGGGGTV